MGENTAISWATNTFNPWWGCRKISPACRFCYAARDSTRWGFDAWGSKGERRMMSDDTWRKPLRWNREAERSGEQVRVFCASMADVFEDHPALVEPRERLWHLIEDTPALTWMLLTKRPENAEAMVPSGWSGGWPGHVWCGVSAETQRFADQRIPALLSLPVVVPFVSAAPLLGLVKLSRWLRPETAAGNCHDIDGVAWHTSCERCGQIKWVITEGESGPRARPSHPNWVRSLRDECQRYNVAFHHKQWGEWGPAPWRVDRHSGEDDDAYKARAEALCATHSYPIWADRYGYKPLAAGHKPWSVERGSLPPEQAPIRRWGKRVAGRLLDGVLWDQFPSAVLVDAVDTLDGDHNR